MGRNSGCTNLSPLPGGSVAYWETKFGSRLPDLLKVSFTFSTRKILGRFVIGKKFIKMTHVPKQAQKFDIIIQRWANILKGGLHHWLMNYQRAASFEIKKENYKIIYFYMQVFILSFYFFFFFRGSHRLHKSVHRAKVCPLLL